VGEVVTATGRTAAGEQGERGSQHQMNDSIGVGVLGFAHGHVGMYCNVWRQKPEIGVKVVAGWDHDAARAEASCASFGIDVAESVEALAARSDVDAVVIGVETSMHADVVEKAAPAGKAILLQKPMALTMDQADRIVNAVNKAGIPFTMLWQMRVDRHNLKAKELLESGEFGKIFQVRRRHCLTTQHFNNFEGMWHNDPKLNRDIFADDAAHPIDFMHWLLGKPVSVVAELATLLNPRVPNDNGIAIFRYPDGSMGEVSCSFVAIAGENTLEIICENGSIIGNYGDGPSNNIPRPAGGVQLKWYLHKDGNWTYSDIPDINGQGERITGLCVPMAEFLRGERPPICTAEEGRESLKHVLACYESAESGRRVSIR
jgi:predicted dehydrogenase